MRVEGIHAIVTGGSQGIGRATAHLLVQRGARVSIVARNRERLDTTVAELGASARAAAADVTDPDALDAAFAELTEQQGPCELLITSAGASHPGYFEQLPLEVFRAQMDLDYFGTLHAIRAVLPAMLERGRGGIVGISSAAGLVGVFGFGAYAPAKYAVRGLCDALHAEFSDRGIYVGCAYPPDTLTPGFHTENEIKPPETAAASGGIKPKTAEAVATAIVKGIERDRRVITADPQTALLAHAGRPATAFAYGTMRRQVRKLDRP